MPELGEHFGKRFTLTPTIVRKQIVTTVGATGTETDVRSTAKFMTHSLDVHRQAYQQKESVEESVGRW